VSGWVCSQLSPHPGQGGLGAALRRARASQLPAELMIAAGKPFLLQAWPEAKHEALPGVVGAPWGRPCGWGVAVGFVVCEVPPA